MKTALRDRFDLLNLGVVAVLAGLCTLTFGPVFGGWPGYLAAGGGSLLGLGLAVLITWRGWGFISSLAATIVTYFLFVGVFALPDTTIAGIFPSLETLDRGLLLIVQAWRDLLTVAVPASSFSGPAVVPFLTALICVTLGGVLAQIKQRQIFALIPMVAFLLVGILWGTTQVPMGRWIGLGFLVVSIAWASYLGARPRREAQQELGIESSKRKSFPRLVAAFGVLALAGGVAAAASPAVLANRDRIVLRNLIEPPLNLQDYASPLMSYRYFLVDQKDVTLFTVDGLPKGARLRLATLDTYDGMVYNVAQSSSDFSRAGAVIEPRTEAEVSRAADREIIEFEVTIAEYEGVWLPGGGELRGVAFEGDNAKAQTKSLYYNSNTGTAIVTAGLSESDKYRAQVVLPLAVDEATLVMNGIADINLPINESVPNSVAKKIAEITEGADGAVEQVLAIEKALQQGYYSDGADGKSLSGHSQFRINSMLMMPQLVGDDEQYAVLMALMLRQLKIPARVVMGFYPPNDALHQGSWEVTGTTAHVWVEVPFNEIGWVAFDPTPDRDRKLETTVPKPNPKPRPRVQPPPVPPEEPLVAPEPLVDDASKDESKNSSDRWLDLGWLLTILKIIGIAGLIASPIVGLALLRRRRHAKRRKAELPEDRLTGGWAEVLDTATDLGIKLEPRGTRREQAVALAEAGDSQLITQLADAVDHGVFGHGTPRDEFIAEVWAGSTASVASLRNSASRWRRISYFVNPSSLRKPALSGPVKDSKRPLTDLRSKITVNSMKDLWSRINPRSLLNRLPRRKP